MITFVIPMHKWTDQIEICFNRLHQQLGANEIIVVADQCELPDLPAKVVQTTKRSYAAGSRNLGAEHATHDVIVFVDSDILVPNNFVKHCEEKYDKDQSSIFCFPMGTEVSDSYTAGFKGMLELYSTHHLYAQPQDTIQQLQGYCCVITKNLLHKTGHWVETRTMELEEYATNIQTAGVKIILENTMLVQHYNNKGFDLFKNVFDRAKIWTAKKLQGRVNWDGKHKDQKNAVASLFSLLLWPSLIEPIAFLTWLVIHKLIHYKWLLFLFTWNNLARYTLYAVIHVLYLNCIALGAITGWLTNKIKFSKL
tara:strand:+ start:672 stop:1598 length:927 start_codon:yes stop_codon:yes gene_type:complete